MVELQLPGNPALLERVIQLIMNQGAHLAEPGEFTFRAYLSGKLDLTQAEGVAATIGAVNDAQLQAAHLLLDGQLGKFSRGLTDDLASTLALVEAGIDFTDQEDVVPISPKALDDRLSDLLARVNEIQNKSRSWGELEALPRVVLVGPPSSGKSTLFNALLGHQRAVASPTPGTTRDVLSEPLTLTDPARRKVQVMLVDIAGLDDPRNALDHDMQKLAHDAIKRADLLLSVSEVADGFTDITTAQPILRIASKADLHPPCPSADIAVSAHTGEGLEPLKTRIADVVATKGVSLSGEMLALQPRHEASIKSTAEYLIAARELLVSQIDQHALDDIELIAEQLRSALDDLASLGGQMTPDDVIGKVFATFCVGK